MLEAAGLNKDAADRQATRHLGDLYHKARRLAKSLQGRDGTRYWTTEAAPLEAVTAGTDRGRT